MVDIETPKNQGTKKIDLYGMLSSAVKDKLEDQGITTEPKIKK
jgi:hypothetical protein